MKNILLLLTLLILPYFGYSQAFKANMVNDKQAVNSQGKTVIKEKSWTPPAGKETKYIYEDKKGVQYPVLQGPRGGFYYMKKSKKTGLLEKRYIKI